MRFRALIVGAVALVATALASVAASAQTVGVADRSESYLPARLDLTGARYTLDSNGFAAKVTVKDLRAGGYTLGFNLTAGQETVHVLVTRLVNGKFVNTITIDLPDEQVSRHCGGLDTTWRNKLDYITVDIPWRCMDQLRKDFKVQAFFGAGLGVSGDPADFIKRVKVGYN